MEGPFSTGSPLIGAEVGLQWLIFESG
jgi:hypothetical protein